MTEGLEGGCLCAKVRFRTTQAPLRTIACHCTFCQRVTGSSYLAESMFPMNAVVLNAGALSSYAHISDGSRKKVFVHFCPNCGTTISLTFERWPEIRGISRGCYDDPNAVEVSREARIYSAWRAITWLGRSAALVFLQISRYLLQKPPCIPSRSKRRASTRINPRFPSHIWTQSAQTGTALPEGVECFAGARVTLEGQAEPSTRHTAPVMARANSDV